MNTFMGIYIYFRTLKISERRKEMTSTPVKDVGSLFTNLAAGAASKTAAANQAGFQTVLNNQTQKGTDGSREAARSVQKQQAAEQQNVADKKPANDQSVKPTDSMETDGTVKVQTKESGSADGQEELSPEELEAAMEVLGTAAGQMLQQTAEALGISVEELQALMEELGMDQLDILDPAKLGALFLQASGAEDSYALVTDGELYEDYQALMRQLEAALQESGRELGTDMDGVKGFLSELQNLQDTASETAPVVELVREVTEPDTDVITDGMQGASAQDAAVQGVNDAVREDSDAGQSQGRGREQKETGSEKEQGAAFFIQNRNAEEYQPQVQQAADISSPWDADTENIMKQIMDYLKIQLKEGTTHLEMQLHPASLGTVQVQIAAKGGTLTANFIAQNEAVKAALESQMTQLIERFDEQGVKVQAIEVTVQTHEFERNLDQNQSRDQGEPAKKNRTRRINLNGGASMDDMENMEAEDALAADMLAASGNTVDYTA